MGWGNLPANPLGLVDPRLSYEQGCKVSAPCGTPVPKKENTDWGTMTMLQIEAQKKKEKQKKQMAQMGYLADDPLASCDYVKSTWEEWERSWVAARKAEDKARLRKSEYKRLSLTAKCRTPFRSENDRSKGFPIEEAAMREAKVTH